jgi:hypothetical protein
MFVYHALPSDLLFVSCQFMSCTSFCEQKTVVFVVVVAVVVVSSEKTDNYVH